MLSMAIVEDEQKWQQFAINEIQKYYGAGVKRVLFTPASYYSDKLEIDCFKTGEEFLKADHTYDIVFMDVELPGNDGFSVAEKYVASHSDVILIIMTTHTEMSRKGYLVNAFRYVDKFHPEEFAEALQSAEKRKRQWMPVVFHIPKMGEVK